MKTVYKRAMFMVEATFRINSCISHYNCGTLGSQKLNKFLEYVCDTLMVNMWCGLLHDCLVGPYLSVGRITTGDIYQHLWQQSVFLQIDDIEWENENGVILKQDGALPHFSLHVRLALNSGLPNYWVGWGGSIAWHPSSPDLTPFHFFMWGYVKNIVYAVNIRDLDHLWGNQYSCSNDHNGHAPLYLDGNRVVLHCLKR